MSAARWRSDRRWNRARTEQDRLGSSRVKVVHFHFGKDGGAERFFVHLVAALGERGVKQSVVIRPGRSWRPAVARHADVVESHFRNLSLDRFTLPLRAKHLVRDADAVMAWMPKGAKLVPAGAKAVRVARLGDYPEHLHKFANIDVLVCNTPGIATHVRQLGWQRGVEVISNFTFAERATPVRRADHGTPDDAFLVTAMGRFVPRKGFATVINAVAADPKAWLWLLGEGELDADLRERAERAGVVDRVRFLGWQADTRAFIAASDAFAMSSSHEPLGNVVLEAWSQDVPVISTRCEGPTWFMRHERDGLMVDINDADGFAAAFRRLRGEEGLADRLRAGGRATLASTFSREAVTDAYLDLFARRQAEAA